MKKWSIETELWREYDFGGRVYRIDKPKTLFISESGTTHRVLGNNGVVHCVPSPGAFGCVLRWQNIDEDKPVEF